MICIIRKQLSTTLWSNVIGQFSCLVLLGHLHAVLSHHDYEDVLLSGVADPLPFLSLEAGEGKSLVSLV